MKLVNIKEVGLRAYLNSTKAVHNGRGYDEWVDLLSMHAGVSLLARAFDVTRPTIYSWLELHKAEA